MIDKGNAAFGGIIIGKGETEILGENPPQCHVCLR
jgi:hypothetical protein